MENKAKIILDLCGGTGSWSKPYAEAGYDVRLVTLPENDVCLYSPPENVYGVLAAPPCTKFSLAKGGRERDFEGAMEIVSACMKIIWKCRIRGSLKFWALENPRGFLRQFLGKPAFKFEHWQFGDLQIKPTDLWGYFNEPRVRVHERPPALAVIIPNGRSNGRGWSNPVCPPEHANKGLGRADIRAITPPGFARAFYEANR